MALFKVEFLDSFKRIKSYKFILILYEISSLKTKGADRKRKKDFFIELKYRIYLLV